jgi:hypothetical protein
MRLSETVAAGVLPAVAIGSLPSGKTVRSEETACFAKLIARRRFFSPRSGRMLATHDGEKDWSGKKLLFEPV